VVYGSPGSGSRNLHPFRPAIACRGFGRRLSNAREFQIALYRIPLNQKVAVEALRGTDKISAQIEVEERDDDPFRFVDLVKEQNRVENLGATG